MYALVVNPLLWQVPLGLALFLALGLLVAWGAGHALSSVRLGQLRADHVHLLRAEQTLAERLVDWLYSAVLWFASLLFYVSVPVLLVLAIIIGAGLPMALLMLPVVYVKPVVLAAIFGFSVLYGVLYGLSVSQEQPEEGQWLSREEAPALFEALAEVASVAKSREVDRVVLEVGTGISVREAGGRLRVLLGRGERILKLGLRALPGLTVSELKSILAHEYGHFSHGETRLTPVIARIEAQVLQATHGLQRLGWARLNPVWWFLRAYFFVYLRITAGHGRRRELLADRLSALAYGGDTFARALTKTVENADALDRGLLVAVGLREAGRPVRDLLRTLEAAERGTPPALRGLVREELLSRPVDAYASHPPPAERIARVTGLPGQRPVEEAPALTLFAAPEELAAELGAALLQRLEAECQAQGLPAAEPVATTDEELDRLAEALAGYYGALALVERQHPEAYALLQGAVARLEQAAGAQDPMLVPVLQELSKAHVQHQNPQAAREALQRAIGIVQARPGHEPWEVDALGALLQMIPAQQAA